MGRLKIDVLGGGRSFYQFSFHLDYKLMEYNLFFDGDYTTRALADGIKPTRAYATVERAINIEQEQQAWEGRQSVPTPLDDELLTLEELESININPTQL